MKFRGVAAFAALLVSASAVSAAPLLVSGEPTLVVVDGDDDGPDSDDCTLFADLVDEFFDATTQQQVGGSPLLFCSGNYLGSLSEGSDTSSDFVNIFVEMGPPGVTEVPVGAVIFDEEDPTDGPPVRLDETIDKFEIFSPINASAFVCNSGQPASVVEFPGLLSLLVPLEFETIKDKRYLKLADRTFGIVPNGNAVATHDAYVPLTPDDRLTLATAAAPNDLIIEIDFANLPECPGSTAAPTLTGLGLLTIALLLLVGGTVVLRRSSARLS